MNKINGGVCAAKGFTTNGVLCRIKPSRTTPDLALIVSETPANAAAVYTQNLVQGAPITVTRQHLQNGRAQAVIVNSGNANTCNANGIAVAQRMCALVTEHTGIATEDVIVASTGVIGQPLPVEKIEAGMAQLVAGMGHENDKAAAAIMTTDTFPKESAVAFTLPCGTVCRVGGMAKGSGMIHINMATMLAFITTDIAIDAQLLARVLKDCCDDTMNMVTVDGDTSTNDMCCVLANGLAANVEITGEGAALDAFRAALMQVLTALSRMLARDGEGATKLLICRVTGAKTTQDCRIAAKGVIASSLFKAAMFGRDANWGRVLCALGYSGADLDVTRIGVRFSSAAGDITVCESGAGVPFCEDAAAKILAEEEITIHIAAGDSPHCATAYGCDLTYDYVKINGDYRT
ncbi:MAG: bifunctional glutamate N-acetyltransferase/amino-acid acetyltransferase ArgJ [Oscillospiraceae bacterium]|nr:bifunctional glutamate N-acetyltransferase/amino-acid acetyltransferase ArgJ [Oscillospiraceae bacterium]